MFVTICIRYLLISLMFQNTCSFSIIKLVMYSLLSPSEHLSKACLKSTGSPAGVIYSTVQVHTTTQRFYREQHWAPYLLRPALHMSSPRCFSGVRVARSLVFCVVFCRSLFVLFSCDHRFVCPLIHGFWLRLLYLQTLLIPDSI